MPLMQLSIAVLPAPFGPTSAISSDGAASNETDRNAPDAAKAQLDSPDNKFGAGSLHPHHRRLRVYWRTLR